MIRNVSSALVVIAFSATASLAAEIPKFGKTCVGSVQNASSICLSSNGKSVSSSYMFRKKWRTAGSHKGCSLSGSTIKCTGGTWKTSDGSGPMNPVTIKLSNGKPTAIRWN